MLIVLGFYVALGVGAWYYIPNLVPIKLPEITSPAPANLESLHQNMEVITTKL
ncbi:MAG: hypothetical protein ABIG89_02585 [Candidatus Woesearchaeota archaeon]